MVINENPARLFREKFEEIFLASELTDDSSAVELNNVAFNDFVQRFNNFLSATGLDAVTVPVGFSPRMRQLELFRDFIHDLNHDFDLLNKNKFVSENIDKIEFNKNYEYIFSEVELLLSRYNVPVRVYGLDINTQLSEEENSKCKIWRLNADSNDAVEVKDIIPGQKNLYICGGMASVHYNHRAISGLIRLAEEKLGGKNVCKEQGINIYCVTYPIAHRSLYHGRMHAFNIAPDKYYSECAHDFAERLLLPAIEITGSNFSITQDILDNCSKLAFLTYSYGSTFLAETRNALYECLVSKGVTEADIEKIVGKFRALQVGPTTQLYNKKLPNQFPSMYILSEDDLQVISKSNNTALISAVENEGVVELDEQHHIYKMGLPADKTVVLKDDGGVRIIKDNKAGHDLLCYLSKCVVGNQRYNPEPAIEFIRNQLFQERGIKRGIVF